MKKLKNVLALLCAAVMVLTLMAPAVDTAKAESVQELVQEKADIAARIEELEADLEKVREDKAKALETKFLLDQQNKLLKEQIDVVEKQVANTEAAIAENEKKEKAQYDLFCRQVRQEEERGPVSFWSVLFNASSFADLIARIDFINEIMEYDRRVMADLQQIRGQLKQGREALEAQQAELNDAKETLDSQRNEANRILSDFIAEESRLEEAHAAEEEASERVDELLNSYYDQSGGNNAAPADAQAVLDGLIWPCDARYITSPYGDREAPLPGASTNHQAVDIGAPWYAPIYAAQSGTIIQAGWNGGYGYSVTIAHDHGVATLYAHMDDYYVYVGEYVSRGQVIGEVGSTGNSTGPHIHYEVRLDGEKINPMPYLPGYIAWW